MTNDEYREARELEERLLLRHQRLPEGEVVRTTKGLLWSLGADVEKAQASFDEFMSTLEDG